MREPWSRLWVSKQCPSKKGYKHSAFPSSISPSLSHSSLALCCLLAYYVFVSLLSFLSGGSLPLTLPEVLQEPKYHFFLGLSSTPAWPTSPVLTPPPRLALWSTQAYAPWACFSQSAFTYALPLYRFSSSKILPMHQSKSHFFSALFKTQLFYKKNLSGLRKKVKDSLEMAVRPTLLNKFGLHIFVWELYVSHIT